MKSNAFFFSTGIVANTGTYIIHQNEAGSLSITSLHLNKVTVSLNNNFTPSNESIYPSIIKFCWLIFDPIRSSSFHFIVTGILFASKTLFHWAEEMINIISVTRKWQLQWWSGSKDSQQNFTRQGYELSFEGGMLPLRETVTLLRSKDVILRELASF